jgi:hypothetical protein
VATGAGGEEGRGTSDGSGVGDGGIGMGGICTGKDDGEGISMPIFDLFIRPFFVLQMPQSVRWHTRDRRGACDSRGGTQGAKTLSDDSEAMHRTDPYMRASCLFAKWPTNERVCFHVCVIDELERSSCCLLPKQRGRCANAQIKSSTPTINGTQ